MRLITAFVVAASVSLSAQTVESTLDLSGLGWGALHTPVSVEVDGDLGTIEWLVESVDTNAFRVVAETPFGLCAGDWFWPRAFFDAAAPQRIGLIHKLIVRPFGSNMVRVVRLDLPRC